MHEGYRGHADDDCFSVRAGNVACLLLATSLLIIALVVPGFLGGFLTVNNCRTTVRSIHIMGLSLMGGCLAHGISSTGDWTTWKSLKSIVHAKHKKIFFSALIIFYYYYFLVWNLSSQCCLPCPLSPSRTNHLVIGHLIHHFPPS